MARIVLTACIFVALIATNAHAQESLDEIYNKAGQIEFPYLSKCGKEANYTQYTIDTTTLKKVFRFRSEEVVYEDFDYDMDNDIKSNVRRKPVDAQISGAFRFNDFKCILLDVAQDQYNETNIYLYTFSKEGDLVDRLSVGYFFIDQAQNIYFVINNDTIKIYKYVENWDMAKNKKKINDAPNMFAHEESYKITPKGLFEFQGKRIYPLKHDSYFKCDHEDDPMVKYIK